MKPTIIRNRQIFAATNHIRSRQLGCTLSKDLREKYGKRSARVVEGDTVRVMRGEFKGIDGKVTQVSTEKNGIAIEGIKREKLKGGNVDIYIHTSNVMITSLNLDDKWRQSRLEGQKTMVPTEKPVEPTKELPKPKEPTKLKEKQAITSSDTKKEDKTKDKQPKTTKEDKKVKEKSIKTKESAKETPKEKSKPSKKDKQTKTTKPMKKENNR